MTGNTSRDKLFKEYYFNNEGTLFKSFEISINTFNYSYSIYWGDPDIIFDGKTLRETYPLAVTIIPQRNNYPNPRIYLHEKLETKYNNAFEVVVAHEIGHLWLHDIVGINNPSTSNYMSEKESEIWADYFAFSYFVKYRNINCLEDFSKVLEEASRLQVEIYNLDPGQHMESTFINRMNDLKLLEENISIRIENEKSFMAQMKNAIEITLSALGDIFN